MGIQTRLNTDWRFHLGDAADADFMGFDDRAWRTVTLPHDWAVEHPFDPSHASGTGYLPGGTAWYRKHFELDESTTGKRVRLTFQGVYKHAKVWVNSNYLGFHAYGYTSFSFDISEFVRPGENVIAVRVEHNNVADSRWYTGSGITRHVLLEISEPVCFRENGVFVSVLHAENGSAAQLRIRYDTFGAEQVNFRLMDRDGVCAAAASAEGEKGETSILVPFPQYWSPDFPYLYTLQCEARRGNRVTDTVAVPVGIRSFRFDPDEGFFLNGEAMKIKGVCVHHDAGCLGAAVPKPVWARRLRKFKEAGCNAIRTAHNPPDPDLLDLCDEMGFLVMDEAFDEWEGTKNKWWQGHNVYPPKHFGYAEDFPQWHEADLSSMVLRDRNHPCVILWSIGNEIDYPNDPYVTPLFKEALGNNDANKPAAERRYDPRKPDAERLAKVAKELVEIVHRLDDTRPVTSALSFPELSNRTGFADELDVVGYNYREYFYRDDHKTYPGRVILGSENSHDPKAWFAVRDNAFMSAQFLWTGIDFLGECRGWPVRISQAGMLNLAGFEKPLFYQRKALWTDEPFVRISAGDGDSERHGVWNEHFSWRGEPGRMKTVSCYTNAKAVSLFLNGQFIGKKQVTDADGCRVTWEVPYQAGTLRAVIDGGEDELFTAKPAASIELKTDKTVLRSDGQDVAQVEIRLLDEDGRPALDEAVHCQAVGDIKLVGIENGRPDDLTPYTEAYRSTLDGSAVAYLRAGRVPGPASLHVWTASGLRAVVALHLLKDDND
ncbi:MAG: DUF4982 domain-containing protein [Clostridia bacterium]|nr:DUF4982 domain-containing protein [Clostridia bacterium]